VEVADQPLGAGDPDRLIMPRQLLEGRDRRASPVVFQDQLESAAGIDAVVEGHLDDRPQAFVVALRLIIDDRLCDAIRLADGPVVGPGRRDVAAVEILRADDADRLHVALLVARPGRLG
jgi:hypothetical protein